MTIASTNSALTSPTLFMSMQRRRRTPTPTNPTPPFPPQPPAGPELKPLPEIHQAPATGNMNWFLAAGVVLFLVVAGGFLYISSQGGSGKNLNAAAAATPTLTT